MPRLRWVFLAVMLGLIVAIMGTAYVFEFREIHRLSEMVDSRMVRLTSLSRKLQEYQEKIDFYKTPEGLAHLARDQYNLVFPGERIYRIVVTSDDVLPQKQQ
ncbi:MULTISPECIES: FtsB family cell division protein [Aminobacterium]|jgi:cell division protein FtsB|uniref:FtsB family cell division protein n=1 Tax=Aminobacterium TaxID=81466 RepID=UPI000467CBDA|nr:MULTISPECIES: septum formation initiator [Aminobacterium]